MKLHDCFSNWASRARGEIEVSKLHYLYVHELRCSFFSVNLTWYDDDDEFFVAHFFIKPMRYYAIKKNQILCNLILDNFLSNWVSKHFLLWLCKSKSSDAVYTHSTKRIQNTFDEGDEMAISWWGNYLRIQFWVKVL